MSQSRRSSLAETIVGTLVGLGVSTILNMTVLPLILDVHVSFKSNLTLTGMFTVASIVRGYYVRRYFNRRSAKSADA